MALYPLTIDAVVKYALVLDSKECGPTVIPSQRSALKWVGSRLAIKLPDLQDKRLLALETDVFQKRAKMIKEAIAMPFEVVQAMEKFVCSGKEPAAARIFTWWLLCMVFASLRFDDAIHVKPLELEISGQTLGCSALPGRRRSKGSEGGRSSSFQTSALQMASGSGSAGSSSTLPACPRETSGCLT